MQGETGRGEGLVDEGNVAFERACRLAMWSVVGLSLLTVVLPFIAGGERLTGALAFKQDFYVAPIVLIVLMLVQRWAISSSGAGSALPQPRLWIAGSIVLVLLVGWAGHYLVFDGFDLSRDEQMATFDMAIFRGGRLFAPIPLAWRPIADALNFVFILPIGAREQWVSSYLPVHAAWRALVSLVADPALASPLMAAFGGVCIWRVARLVWPTSTGSQLACVLLYAGSSQALVTAMTAYSMSMHLALNMLWLWLFLLDRRRTHAAAIAVGFLATGIHQPVFHAMFVAPFLLMLLSQRRWRLLATYFIAYALIGAFWLAWPMWISSHGNVPAVAIDGTGGVDFLTRLRSILGPWKNDPPWIMAANLLRFLCWQHPLALPLSILGVGMNFRREPLCRALAIGVVLPILVTAILLPWQGYGWGYRYVHPVLGNVMLLAGYGWRTLELKQLDLRAVLVRSTALAIFIIFPCYAVTTHGFVAPFSELRREIASSPADIVIVDTGAAPYSDDLVLNQADLSNRPITLLAGILKPEDMQRVCSFGSIAFLPGQRLAKIARLYGSDVPAGPTPQMAALIAQAPYSGCRIKSFLTKAVE